jgi:antitoxin PrlF
MPVLRKPASTQVIRAKVTSKGQITVPIEVRKSLGIKPGDRLRFEQGEGGIRVVREAEEDPVALVQGIGVPGIAPGREGIMAYMRELRGYDEFDDSLA